MSSNPSRKLKRQAMRMAGYRCPQPRSGRRRGRQRQDALRDVAIVTGVWKARAAREA